MSFAIKPCYSADEVVHNKEFMIWLDDQCYGMSDLDDLSDSEIWDLYEKFLESKFD